jgi:vancomycin resistance protein YoaR
MSQQYPSSDETVRMPADGGTTRSAPAVPSQGFGDQPDDTRPVSRDWQRGAPETAAGEPAEPTVAPPAPGPASTAPEPAAPPAAAVEAGDTQRIDLTDGENERTTAIPPVAADPDPRADLSADAPPYENAPTGPRGPWWRRRAVLAPAGAAAVLAVAYGVDLLAASGEIPRSTVVAGVDLGGLSPARAADVLDEELAPRVATDRPIAAADVDGSFSPTAAGIALDVPATLDAADEQPLNPWVRLTSLFSDREVDPVLDIDRTALDAQLETIAATVDRAPSDATILVDGTTPQVVEPAEGRTLDRDAAERTLVAALSSDTAVDAPVELPVDVEPFGVDTDEAQRVLDETVLPALSAPVTVAGSGAGAPSAEVPVPAIAASLTFTPSDGGELQVGLDPVKLQESLGDELGVFGIPAKDAGFEVSGGAVRVVPSQDGTGIDPVHLVDQLLPVLTDPAPRSVTAELGPVPAEFTTEEAEKLGIREEISSFTTNISNPRSGENIRVVAEEVDGALVMPGETFSLNTFTGPRGTAQGYVPATVISGGELGTAVGGGISQFATTMFNAVFFAGLEDVFHKPHSFYISRYPAGREATVYEGVIDLQWRNDSDTGVFVDTQWTPGSITVTFYGTRRFEIESVSSDRTNPRQPAVQEKVDTGDCIPQSGVPGFDITVTRIFRDLSSGAEIRRESFDTRYAAEAVIRCIAPPAEAPPAPDGTVPPGPPSPGGRRPSRPRSA